MGLIYFLLGFTILAFIVLCWALLQLKNNTNHQAEAT